MTLGFPRLTLRARLLFAVWIHAAVILVFCGGAVYYFTRSLTFMGPVFAVCLAAGLVGTAIAFFQSGAGHASAVQRSNSDSDFPDDAGAYS